MRVKCPKCKRTNTYITTDEYNPDITPHGGMVKLRNPKHKGGMTFGVIKGGHVTSALMECCDCGGRLTQGGRLIVLPEVPEVVRELTQAEKNQQIMDIMCSGEPITVDGGSEIRIPMEAGNITITGAFVTGGDCVAGAAIDENGKAYDAFCEPVESCPKCGKTESDFKNRSGFVNHCRKCSGKGGE